MSRGRKPGFHHSEETKQKMRKPHAPRTPEHCQKLKEAQTGMKMVVGADGKRHWQKVSV